MDDKIPSIKYYLLCNLAIEKIQVARKRRINKDECIWMGGLRGIVKKCVKM